MTKMGSSTRLDGYLVLPSGTDKKWDLNTFRISAVAADGLCIRSNIPYVYIDKKRKKALTLANFESVYKGVFSYEHIVEGLNWDVSHEKALEIIETATLDIARKSGETSFELKFCRIYFEHLRDRLAFTTKYEIHLDVFTAMLPLPQVHIYTHDPLHSGRFVPENAFRLDFGFWDGKKIVAVELDGNSPDGYASDVRRPFDLPF